MIEWLWLYVLAYDTVFSKMLPLQFLHIRAKVLAH